MTRQEFLKQIYSKYIKPYFLITLILTVVFNILNSFLHAGESRDTILFTIKFILAVVVFIIILEIIRIGLTKIKKQIISNASPKTIEIFKKVNQILELIYLVTFGVFLYHSWLKKDIFIFLYISFIVIILIKNKIKKEEVK